MGDWVYSQRGEVVNGLSTFSKETFHSKNCTLNICSLQGTADGHTDMARFPFFFQSVLMSIFYARGLEI